MIPHDVLAVLAFGFLIAAAAKSAQFPFQTWLPDAMEAPTPVSALIHAATMVNAGVYLLARFYPALRRCRLDDDGHHRGHAFGPAGCSHGAGRAGPEARAGLLYREPAWLHGLRSGRRGYTRQPVPPVQPCRLQGAALPGCRRVIHAIGTRNLRQMAGWASACL